MPSQVLKFNFKPSGGNYHSVWPRNAGKMGNFLTKNEGKFLGEEWNKSISSEWPRLQKHPAKVHKDAEKRNGNIKALLG